MGLPGEFFFMAIGGLGVSLAGFAGLVAALTPAERVDSPVTRWRISRIVAWGLELAFLGFGVVAIFSGVGDVETTVRIATAVIVLALIAREWRATRPGPAWSNERQRRAILLGSWVIALAISVNIVLGEIFILHLTMLYVLSAPMLIFVAAIRDVSGKSQKTDTSRSQA